MSIDICLNELSLLIPAEHFYNAQQNMLVLVQTLRQARTAGINGKFRVPISFHTTKLAPGYFLMQWLNDKSVDLSERRFIERQGARSPFLIDMGEIEEKQKQYEFTFDTEPVEGFGVAYLLEGLAISLPSENRWNTSEIALVVKNIDQDLNITVETVTLLHASHPEHISSHESWIQSRLKRDIQNGTQMWEQRNQHFPSISFCSNVESQMRTLRMPMFRFVLKRLFDIQEACHGWTTGGFDPMNIAGQVSPESKSTMDQFGDSRKFRCPDGVERTFDWHVKISHEAWRIYIIWDDERTGKLTIGYIGKHLRTVHDPT